MKIEILLIVVVGFLAGMIPAMLIIGFWGGRQAEKNRKELQLKYERQVVALRATLKRLMQRIDILTGERNQLKKANSSMRNVLREQRQFVDSTSLELERNRADLSSLKKQVEDLTAKNYRYEGRLEEAQLNQERLTAQYKQTVSEFTEVDRLRRHLLYATNQLRQFRAPDSSTNTTAAFVENTGQTKQKTMGSPAEMDVSVIETIEPLYVERLHESGIHTVADLAGQTPARIAHFVGLADQEDSKQWVARAQALINNSTQATA